LLFCVFFVFAILLCFLFFCCLIVQLGGNNLVDLVNLTEWVKQRESRMSNCSCILEFF